MIEDNVVTSNVYSGASEEGISFDVMGNSPMNGLFEYDALTSVARPDHRPLRTLLPHRTWATTWCSSTAPSPGARAPSAAQDGSRFTLEGSLAGAAPGDHVTVAAVYKHNYVAVQHGQRQLRGAPAVRQLLRQPHRAQHRDRRQQDPRQQRQPSHAGRRQRDTRRHDFRPSPVRLQHHPAQQRGPSAFTSTTRDGAVASPSTGAGETTWSTTSRPIVQCVTPARLLLREQRPRELQRRHPRECVLRLRRTVSEQAASSSRETGALLT